MFKTMLLDSLQAGVLNKERRRAFTLVEMLMALLIVSVILSASLPVITSRQKAQIQQYSRYNSFPIGGVIIWGASKALPDNTWLECNGQAIPNGIEYNEIRQIYGTNLPDYRGVFLRGYGSITHTQNNGSTIGNTATTHSSGEIGVVQGDGSRKIEGEFSPGNCNRWSGVARTDKVFYPASVCPTCGTFAGTMESWAAFNNLYEYTGNKKCSAADTANFDSSRVIPTANELRPINKAVKYIIKVKN